MHGLTPRESEVFRLVLGGYHDKNIATALNISQGTVRTHVTSVCRYFGVSGRLALMAMFTLSPG